MDIPFPFSLVNNDVTHDRLQIMPAYWLIYNQFALGRNSWKNAQRDKRTERIQNLESSYLAPDTVNSMFDAVNLLSKEASNKHQNGNTKDSYIIANQHYENSKRSVELLKPEKARLAYLEYIKYYAVDCVVDFYMHNPQITHNELLTLINQHTERKRFVNVGGQLICENDLNDLKTKIISYEIISWQQVHEFYLLQGKNYPESKLAHACASLHEITGEALFTTSSLAKLLDWYLAFREMLLELIRSSRQKDYENPFRKMLYENQQEMESVIGKLDKTPFILEEKQRLLNDKIQVKELISILE
jgi:hypothetical protein